MTYRFLACLLFWVTAAVLAPGAEKKAEVRFAAQSAPKELGKIVMTVEEVSSEPFDLPLNNLSPPLEAPARVFELKTEDKENSLAKVKLPAAGDSFVVLLVLGEKTPFEAVVIPARDPSFKVGDYYLHNVSKKPVMGKVGKSQFGIRPREGKVVRPTGARDDRFYDVTLGVLEGDEPRVISTSRWPKTKQIRTYVFFFDDPRRKDVDFRAIDEFVPAEGG